MDSDLTMGCMRLYARSTRLRVECSRIRERGYDEHASALVSLEAPACDCQEVLVIEFVEDNEGGRDCEA